jgi:hypothetical protein
MDNENEERLVREIDEKRLELAQKIRDYKSEVPDDQPPSTSWRK